MLIAKPMNTVNARVNTPPTIPETLVPKFALGQAFPASSLSEASRLSLYLALKS